MDPTPNPASTLADENLPPARKPTTLFDQVLAFIGSYSIGIVVMLLLIVLTLIGTFSQAEIGLYETQKKYFDTLWYWQELGPIKFPMPGVYLLLLVLFVNLLAGGILRIRKKPQTIGVIIAHFSILFLIVAGWVSFHWKSEGHLALYPGQQSDVIEAYHDWQIEIREVGKPNDDVRVIKDTEFADCVEGKARTFYANGLPFDLKVSGYERNGAVVEEGHPRLPANTRIVDHFGLAGQPVRPNNEENQGACYIDLVSNGQTVSSAVLQGQARNPKSGLGPPFVAAVGDRQFAFALVRDRWKAPFVVKVDKFTIDYYPNTQRAKDYRSDITKLEGGTEERHLIGMNSPLRHKGWTYFQGSFGRAESDPPGTNYTVFVVVSNPADSWPLWSLLIATCGLLIHFVAKLVSFLVRQGAPVPPAPTPTPSAP